MPKPKKIDIVFELIRNNRGAALIFSKCYIPTDNNKFEVRPPFISVNRILSSVRGANASNSRSFYIY